MKKAKKRVIPLFGLSMGVTLSILSLVVLIPLASLVIYTAQMDFGDFIQTITRERVLASFKVSFITAFIASLINAVMGVIIAWVLVRYQFLGKRIIDGMIELPFALPTAVAGMALTSLTTDNGLIGSFFDKFGIKIAYTQVGITIALIFIGIPFVVRSVQPILEKLDSSYEEAAGVLGASRTRIFWKIIFPEIRPAVFTGFGLYDKKFINVMRELNDPTPFLRGIVAELGFKRKEIPYEQPKRRAGKTHNNFYRL